jgi:hypothetical protein
VIGILALMFAGKTLKAEVTRENKPGYSATGLSSGSVVLEIED